MDYLIDCDRKEKRFKIKSLLVSGDHFQVALVEDTFEDLSDDKPVLCAKTVAYDDDRIEDKEYIALRKAALEDELEFLQLGIEAVPEPIEWLNVESEEDELDIEPVLVVEFKPGHTLEQIVEVQGAMEPERVRNIAIELLQFLKECHEKGWVFRNLHPSHIVAAADDTISIIGTGNATRIGKAPNLSKTILYQGYLAPEIREEVGGSTLQPAADIYTFGALLSFLLTGEHPRASIESPLTERAYYALVNLQPEGLPLIVAKCMAPMAKNRFTSIDELLPYLERDQLPTSSTPGFGMLLIPAPWLGSDSSEMNRSLNSSLTDGPLISVPSRNHNREYPTKCREKRRLAVISILVVLGIAVALFLFSVISN